MRIVKWLWDKLQSSKVQIVLFILSLMVLSAIVYRDTITSYPKGRHLWSQSDRLSIAFNYAEESMNLFKPRSYVLNPYMVPPSDSLDTLEGITRVDFPVQEYMAGSIMKVLNYKEPVVFRLFNLIISLVGFVFLYKLMKKYTGSFWNSVLTPLFLFSLPVYMFYQCNFSSASSTAGLCFIGYYYYFKYLQEEKFSYFMTTGIFLFLAILFRLPFAIPLIAVICQQALSYILTKRIVWKEVAVFASIFVLIFVYYKYNQYIESKYGSIYLTYNAMASSWKDFTKIMGEIIEYQKHMPHFFPIHVKCLCILIANAVLWCTYNLVRKTFSLTRFQKQFLLQGMILVAGSICYFILMQKQYWEHDYYFLDTFLVPAAFVLCFLFSCINWKWKPLNFLIQISLTVMILIGFVQSVNHYKVVLLENFSPDFEQNIRDMKTMLDKHHIGEDKMIIIPDKLFPANNAFCRLRRHGFCDSYLEKHLPNTDYMMITEWSMVNCFIPGFPEQYSKLEYLDKCNTVLLFKYTESPVVTYQVDSTLLIK